MSVKLNAGDAFPSIEVTDSEGNQVTLGQPRDGFTWQAVLYTAVVTARCVLVI